MNDKNMKKLKKNEIITENPDSRWAALSFDSSKMIAEGKTPEEVIEKADKLVGPNNYVMTWMPDPNITYIF